jgi:hypothetical protein
MNLDARTAKKTDALPEEGEIIENGLLMPERMAGQSTKWGRLLKEAWLHLVNAEFRHASNSYAAMARLYHRGPTVYVRSLEEAGMTTEEAKRTKEEFMTPTPEERKMSAELYERHLKLAYRATGGPH